MINKTIELYEYSELEPKAKEKALDVYRAEYFDDYSLQVHLDNLISDLLDKHNIKPSEDSRYAKVYYSLGNSQGDGAMFDGTFDWKNCRVYIKHSGHYYHSNSKTIEMNERDNEGIHIDEDEKVWDEFETIYQSICKELERAGYDHIDDIQSEAYFIEECNANEWTFRKDGTREDIDE